MHKFLKNSFWLTLAQGFNGVANLCLIIYLARVFGPRVYGQFAYALSFVTLFSTLFDFGLTMAATKEFTRDQSQEKNFLNLFIIKTLIGIAAILLIFGLSFVITDEPVIQKMIIILGLYQLFFQSLNLFYAVFRSRQTMGFEAFVRIVQTISLIAMVVLVIFWRSSIVLVSFSYLFAVFVAFIVVILLMLYSKQFFGIFSLDRNFFGCKRFLAIGLYLALSQGVGDIMTNTDSFLLGSWGMLTGVGLYNAAAKINAAILFPMSIISTAIFPVLITALKMSKEAFRYCWTMWAKYTMVLSILAAFLVVANSEGILALVYGAQYVQAALTLKILMLMAIALYIGNLYFQVLLIFDLQRWIFYGLCCGTVLNVLCNLLLIPHFGIAGSATATVVGQLVNGVFYIKVFRRKTNIQLFNKEIIRVFLVAMVSSALMWFILSVLHLKLFYSLFFGILLYMFYYFIFSFILNKFRFML